MSDLTAWLAALLFLTFAAHRLLTTRGGRTDPTQRDTAGFALCAGTAMLLNAPAVSALLDRPAAEILLPYQLNAAAAAFLALIAPGLGPTAPRPALRRRRVHAALLFQLLAVSLFLGAGVTVTDTAVTAAPGRGWVLASYNTLFAGYVCWCLYVMARALLRRTRGMRAGSLRTGFVLATLATATAALWALWTLDDVAANLVRGSQATGEDLVSTTLGMITAVLATAGATATLWSAPVRWWRARRAHRALDPLWSALYAELPEIALAPHHRTPLRQAEFALYRRVIEIRDGSLALRPYHRPEVLVRAAEAVSSLDDREAVFEAAVLAAALEAKRTGQPPVGVPGYPAPTAALETVEDEAAWLARVSRAFTESQVVREVRAGAAAG
ncbi:MAB_1171c family putative transporter [Streptomyces sp. NPDC004539]|uniref:MAB_1171c family putative transporter n=1 Tax=Streptomyces sp. NPDC004539 TaxID=3154280 RepID=UPI0033A64DBB